MRAITTRDRETGADGLSLTDMPYPVAAENDVIVRVHAAGFTRGEPDWPGTRVDGAGHDRAASVTGHELSGVVDLGYGTTGLAVGQRVLGLTDWTCNGSLAEYAAVKARNAVLGLSPYSSPATIARLRWYAPAARSSPSPRHPRSSPRNPEASSS